MDNLLKGLPVIIGAAILSIGLIVAFGNNEQATGGNVVPGINLYPQTMERNVVRTLDDVTLTQGQSGSIVYSTSTFSTTTLPAARAGLEFTFIVDQAIATGDWIIDSAEGDNINGTLSVNNADVACSGEDQVQFVTDGETIGDWFKLVGYDSGWLIVGSETETAGKLTCTDPS